MSNLAPDAALVLPRVSAKVLSDVAAWIAAKAVPGVEADVLNHELVYSSEVPYFDQHKQFGDLKVVVCNFHATQPATKKAKTAVHTFRLTTAQALDVAQALGAAASRLSDDTRARKTKYGDFVTLEKLVAFGDVTFVVDNSALAKAKKNRTPAKGKRVPTSCHESGQDTPEAERLKCVTCGKLFGRKAVTDIYKANFDALKASQFDDCWHCRDVCCRSGCVKKREGDGDTAEDVVKRVTGKSANACALYFGLVTAAKAAGCKCVNDHVAKAGSA